MDIEVLGALSVRKNGLSIAPTAPKPRQVLALLALHSDQVVPLATLAEELWDDAPPRSARTTVQTYVMQLRELIGEALARHDGERRTAKDVLVTLPGGYRLETGGDGEDAEGTADFREFERRATAGHRAMDAGDHTGAARLLREALALWTGSALTGVHQGTRLRTEAERLEEARLAALDRRIEADLLLGRHRELLSELTVLVSRHPMHEALHGQFMLALHRSGRRSEALDAYQRLRATLVAQAGLEPSAALGRLQMAILAARPGSPVPDGAPVTERLVARAS
ncbi:AfsR/SARP family transcriptional regulator [Streptomyces melanogenes]|uniref:AfsR/SARP family transcriptional regulator n=1 Tax=Streptomyces melanogenes TaxID=67326 RepID=UPI00167EE7AC|nr:AfsR/SARP family transcriptional regulator [Streptomyces melanogenes]GGP53562.1 SARP family transcriptional regulator [Streptomyces melanogenes]